MSVNDLPRPTGFEGICPVGPTGFLTTLLFYKLCNTVENPKNKDCIVRPMNTMLVA